MLGVTVWARSPVGAGVYYDDGIYLALARSLAEGEGYRYANLPGSLPGVKYPPLYPLVLAGVWKTLGPYPGNLAALKAANALLWAGAAVLFFLLFAGGGRGRTTAMAAVTAFGFLAVPSLAIATTLLSEPLFLLLAGGALLAARRARAAAGGAGGWWLVAGGLAAAALLTRSIGAALAAAVAVAALAAGRRPARARLAAAGLAAAPPAVAAAAWFGWTASAGGRIPEAIAGHYGAYAGWYLAGAGADGLGAIGRTAAAAGAALPSTLRLLWAPGAPGPAGAAALLIVGGCAAFGARAVLRRDAALPLFVLLYLALVFVWPYDPDRFLWTIHPLLTLLAAEGIAAALPALRADLPRAGVPIATVGLAALALNTLRYEVGGHVRRAWEIAQRAPAAAFDPLAAWIRENAPPDAVIASRLDPYLYWQTGRRALPAWIFRPQDYGREERDPALLASELEAIRTSLAPDYLAVVRGENKAWLTAAAYARRHPERIEVAFEAGGGAEPGVIYRFLDGPGDRGSPSPATPPTPR